MKRSTGAAVVPPLRGRCNSPDRSRGRVRRSSSAAHIDVGVHLVRDACEIVFGDGENGPAEGDAPMRPTFQEGQRPDERANRTFSRLEVRHVAPYGTKARRLIELVRRPICNATDRGERLNASPPLMLVRGEYSAIQSPGDSRCTGACLPWAN